MLPDPAALVPRAENNPCTEQQFLDFAYTYLEHQPLAFLLDSAGPVHERSRFSTLSGSPLCLFLQDGAGVNLTNWQTDQKARISLTEFFDWVEAFSQHCPAESPARLFCLWTYELNHQVPSPLPHPLWTGPQAVWLLTSDSWLFDRRTQTLTGPAEPKQVFEFTWPHKPHIPALGWRDGKAPYLQQIAVIQNDIYEGNFYQANLSQRFLGETVRPPLEIYRAMRKINPSPYMGIFRMDGFHLLSGSPELLISRTGQQLASRPIAGTRPRGKSPTDDQRLADELRQNEKELAEHLMLVDLIRNDLGRVSRFGSVQVPEFCAIETYSHVHHLVSHIVGQANQGLSLRQLMDAMHPGGTITGAPKLSCMKRLAELERECRGPYTGSIGVLRPGGDFTANILIRSLMVDRGKFCFHGGGGIVADSEPEKEYAESRQKCLALMNALGIWV
ncbi:MAG: anthranilate synthase component I family protein [Acidobacteria bacterium]|nr:anthranilate synthase component I family protein [Acidobacteriota bacterium]